MNSYKKKLNMTWDSRILTYLLLFHELKNYSFKKICGGTNRKYINPKNTQFAIRWAFARFLKLYYNTKKINNVENRIDILLFRTNWFLNLTTIRTAIKNGLIIVNNKVIKNPNTYIKPGDTVRLLDSFNKKNILINYYKEKNIKIGFNPFTTKQNGFAGINEWKNKLPLHMLQNVNYLEINNNIKTFILLKSPKYCNIPYPTNLHKYWT